MSSGLHNMKPPRGSNKRRKRIGCGPGSGHGKTSCRGQKGQSSRTGKSTGIKRGFEGGQMPLARRLPKRGFINPFRRPLEIVNVRDLARFAAGAVVDPEAMLAQGLVASIGNGVKVLGVGEIDRPLTVRAHAISATARRKVEQAGGTVDLLGGAASEEGEPGPQTGSEK